MSDLKLFRIDGIGNAIELPGKAMTLEKSLQVLLERNLPTFFGVRLLASEYSTGAKHGGRIDSLGLDENSAPVIFEYKRTSNENVISQGLFYLDWMMDHKAEFEALTVKILGAGTTVDWSSPRLVCVAGSFNRYDEHAVQQIDRNIDLIMYRDFGGELLALEHIAAVVARPLQSEIAGEAAGPKKQVSQDKTVTESLSVASGQVRDLYEQIEAFTLALGDDVAKKTTKFYIAYRKVKNFACVEVRTKELLIFVKLDPATVQVGDGFARDVSNIGHFGTGDLELRISDEASLQRALPLIQASYDQN